MAPIARGRIVVAQSGNTSQPAEGTEHMRNAIACPTARIVFPGTPMPKPTWP
jgi:hypothetical protein